MPKRRQIDYVLGSFDEEEEAQWPNLAILAAEVIRSFALQGIERTMNTYNARTKDEAHKKSHHH